MITPHLERLIWEGKAAFKTFSVGGTDKHILSVRQNTWIIITGLVYFPRLPGSNQADWANYRITQLNVFSKNAFNTFQFRNNYLSVDGLSPQSGYTGSPTVIPTYLIHEADIAFVFSNGVAFSAVTTGLSQPSAASLDPPLDYGNAASPGAVPTVQTSRTSATDMIYQGGDQVPRVPGLSSYKQLQFPVSAATQATDLDELHSMPVLLVNYVQIDGAKPENIGLSY